MVNVSSGVKQGDSVSPTLFALYVNDLITGLNSLQRGVQIDGDKVCCLMYADDMVLLAGSEDDMQVMLNFVHTWCKPVASEN